MKGKMMKRLLAGVLSFALIFSVAPASVANANEATPKVTVKIGEADPVTYENFDAAIAAVRAADDDATKTITLSAGTFNATDANTFRIDEPNVTIQGAGADKTIIDTGDKAVSGQAGVLLNKDNIKISDLTVISTNPGPSGGAIKATAIGDGENPMDKLEGIVIENVTVSTEKGYGLNLHGVKDATVKNVTVEKAEKAAVSVALADGIAFTGLTTKESGWNTDILMQYNGSNTSAYYAASTITVTDSTLANNVIVSDRPADATGGTDKVDIDGYATVENADGTWVMIPEEKAVTSDDGKAFITIQSAIDAAEEGATINIPAGEYKENLKIDKDLNLVGAGAGKTVIKFVPEDREAVAYFSGNAYPVIYAAANLSLRELTVAGPTDQHHGIDGILAKGDLAVNNVEIKDIRCTADGNKVCGVQYGKGIIVDGDGDVTITNSTIKDFQKQAIDIKTSGKVLIEGNTITGIGDNGIIGQNGIVLRGGAEATVKDNVISQLRYTADNAWTDCAYAVITTNNVELEMTENTIKDVDNGIEMDDSSTGIINNNIIDADWYGLVVYSDEPVDAADNYWGNSEVWVDEENGSVVTGLDDVKKEPIIDDGQSSEEPEPGEDSKDPEPDDGDKEPVTDKPIESTEKDPGDTDKERQKSSTPKMGDQNDIMLWIALLALTGSALAGTVAVNRRKTSIK